MRLSVYTGAPKRQAQETRCMQFRTIPILMSILFFSVAGFGDEPISQAKLNQRLVTAIDTGGDQLLVQSILNQGADPDVFYSQDGNSSPVIYLAIGEGRKGNFGPLRALLKNGADLSDAKILGYAAGNTRFDKLERSDSQEVVRLLLKYGAEPGEGLKSLERAKSNLGNEELNVQYFAKLKGMIEIAQAEPADTRYLRVHAQRLGDLHLQTGRNHSGN